MDYKTLMVHLELNGDNAGVLAIAGSLAERFKAGVIGIVACQPLQILSDEGCTSGELQAADRAEITREIVAIAGEFRAALAGRATRLEWRSAITYQALADYIAEEARAADLIITGRDIGSSLLDNTRRVNIGALTIRAGRPVLLVPQGVTKLELDHVFVAWKDAKEARRAVADALPLLRQSKNITVLEVVSSGHLPRAKQEVQDVTTWLEQHGVSATAMSAMKVDTDAETLLIKLREGVCDLLVAGAYGHNRLSEWVFGGVTNDFLLDPDFCVLLSH
jgi:nucleotide-binding universal stress UspA family protein